MENYSYNSYPESGGSSPRSREIDFENPPPWEDNTNNNYKVKLLCSYGGKINPRPHDNQLSYIGGETKILSVDRSIKFSHLVAKLSALCEADACFKYQLPGEDLDALISVTNDDDLDHMMNEYDRLYRVSPKPARLRLFLFPVSLHSPANSFGSTERDRFVDALISGPVQPSTPPSAVPPLGNADFLFSTEKVVPPAPAPVAVPKVAIADPPIRHHEPEVAMVMDDRGSGADRIQKHIQDLQRLRIAEEQQQSLYRTQSDDGRAAGYTGDYYLQRRADKVVSTTPPGSVPSPAPGYQISADQQPVYMVPAPSSMYHAPMPRPVTGSAGHGQAQGQGQGQGYYAVQRMPTEVYRDQPVYTSMPLQAVQSMATQQPIQPPQPLPQKYAEGMRMVHPTAGMADPGYAQVAYDNGPGRHVYYTAQGTMVTPQPPLQPTAQHYQASAALNQDGSSKVVAPNKFFKGSI